MIGSGHFYIEALQVGKRGLRRYDPVGKFFGGLLQLTEEGHALG